MVAEAEMTMHEIRYIKAYSGILATLTLPQWHSYLIGN